MIVLALCALAMQDVAFKGAQAVPERELREITERDVRRWRATGSVAALDDAAFRIARRYRTIGHYFAEVDVESAEGIAIFHILEGPSLSIGTLRFDGNRVFTSRELRELVPAAPGFALEETLSDQTLAVKREAILGAYRRRGYIEATVTIARIEPHIEDSDAHVTFIIEEGRPYGVAGVEGLEESLRPLLQGLIGHPYSPGTPIEAELRLVDHLRERGHPYPDVRVRPRIDAQAAAVTLLVDAKPGPFARIGEIRVKGNGRTRDAFVRTRTLIEKGDLYRASSVARARDRLQRTGLFRTVSVVPQEVGQDGMVPLEVQVEEYPAGEVGVRAGYGTLDGLIVGGDVAYRNVLGGGEVVRAGATYGQVTRRGTGELAVPYVLNTELLFAITAYYEERTYPSFEAGSYGALPSLTHPLDEHLRLTGGVRFAVVDTIEVDDNVPPGDELDFNYRALTLAAIWDSRDDILLPSRGVIAQVAGEWAADFMHTDIQFLKLTGAVTVHIPLPWSLVLAIAPRAGWIDPREDTQEIPISLRFFAGGPTTARGFEYARIGPEVDGEPTGGELYAALQVELRFPIWRDLHGAIFTDRAGVWFHAEDFDLDDVRWSVGGGLRYYTPAGPIVADVAWNPSREEGEDPVEAHISIGFPF